MDYRLWSIGICSVSPRFPRAFLLLTILCHTLSGSPPTGSNDPEEDLSLLQDNPRVILRNHASVVDQRHLFN